MPRAKQLSNPFSTGSGGALFETKVQTGFVALMLSEGVCPCLHEAWPISQVALQTRYQGPMTDDFKVVTRNDDTGEEAKLFVQAKHSITFNRSDTQIQEVLQAAWSDFKNPNIFKRDYDAIALVTGPLSKKDTNNVCSLLDSARGAGDAQDFIQKIGTGNFIGAPQQEKFSVIRDLLTNSNNNICPSDDELWCFLKHFFLLGFDMDLVSGICVSLLQSIIGKSTEHNVKDVWRHILEVVQHKNARAGIITLENIDQSLKRRFKTKSTPSPAVNLISVGQIRATTRIPALNLIGGWDENNAGDREIIQSLSGMTFSNWESRMREIWGGRGR